MTDRALIDSLSRGEQAAANYLYEHYWPEIHQALTQKGIDTQAAEDIFQEALLAEFRQRKTRPLELKYATYRTYFKTICNNLYKNYCRKNRRRISVTPEELTLLGEEGVIERVLESIVYQQIIDDALNRIDEPCREILSRQLIAGQQLDAIAKVFDITHAAARKRASRCKEKLRNMISADPRYREMKS